MSRQCSATVFGPRVHSWQCVRKAVVARNGKWFCRQHDPEAVAAKDKAKAEARREQQRASDAIEMRGQALLRALGIRGGGVVFSSRTYVEKITIPFGEAEDLVRRLTEGR